MVRANRLDELIWERFAPRDAPADTAVGLSQRFGVEEEEALEALARLVSAGRLESLVVGRLTVFCRVGRRPLLLDRWYVSEPSLWRRSSSNTATPARRPAATPSVTHDAQAAVDK